MNAAVRALLDPRSVAVIGASSNPLKRGYQAIRRLQEDGFPHPVYPVNPHAQEILGLPVYERVDAIPGPVDLALLVTPAEQVPALLRACGQKGVAAAVVIAVGFGETGEPGRKLEEEAAQVATEHGIGLVGPNTNGVFNLPARLNLVGIRDVPEGPVALVCQSGNMALSLFSEAAYETELGFSTYVGIGNEAGLRYDDVLDYLSDDDDSAAVLMYVEGFRDGRAFLAAARRLSETKPVVVYKAGRSEAARRSALSHTGAMVGSPRVADSLLRQAGVVVVERSDELLGVCETLVGQPLLASPRIAVLADGGGHATVAADALTRWGIELPELTPATQAALAELLPAAASTVNPVDVAGATDRDPRVFDRCLELLVADERVDGVLCVGLLGGYGIRFSDELAEVENAAAERMAGLAAARRVPLVVQSAYAGANPPAHRLLRRAGVPVFGSVETAARSLAALRERGEFLATADERTTFPPVAASRRPAREATALTEPEGRVLLARHGLPVGPWTLAADAEATAKAVADLGAPVALKIVSPDVVHKSDVGGVLLDIGTPDEARRGFTAITAAVAAAQPGARIEGVLVAPMAPAGVELLVGATIDESFGPLLTVGAGGTAVELLDDVAFRAIPATEAECVAMLEELSISALLDGYRGVPPVDRAALVELLVGVCALVQAEPGIVELDLNPVVAHAEGLALADVRVVVRGVRPDAARNGRRPRRAGAVAGNRR